MKKLLALALVLVMAMSLVSVASAEVVLKISIAENSTDYKAAIVQDFANAVTEGTDGRKLPLKSTTATSSAPWPTLRSRWRWALTSWRARPATFYASYGSPDIMATALFYTLPSARGRKQDERIGPVCQDVR